MGDGLPCRRGRSLGEGEGGCWAARRAVKVNRHARTGGSHGGGQPRLRTLTPAPRQRHPPFRCLCFSFSSTCTATGGHNPEPERLQCQVQGSRGRRRRRPDSPPRRLGSRLPHLRVVIRHMGAKPKAPGLPRQRGAGPQQEFLPASCPQGACQVLQHASGGSEGAAGPEDMEMG